MNVALNTQTATGQKSGFGSYVSNLLQYMPEVAPEVHYQTFQPVNTARDLSTPRRLMWDQWGFPRNIGNANLIHQPSFSAPIFTRKKVVVTVHDIIPTLFPENFSRSSQFFFGRFMPFSYRFADAYLTVSEHSKKDLVKYVQLDPAKITVTPLAASVLYHPLKTPAEQENLKTIKEKYNIPGDYFLHVGTIEPRKNLPFLVKAFTQAGVRQSLVITGKKGWWYDELIIAAEKSKQVILTDYLPDEELPALYAGATALLFPSLYEGFGLPALEAMQSGTPVIASNTSSLPELVGEAGLLLDPTDQAAWSQAIAQLASDPKQQKMLSQQGLEKAAGYSWQKTAAATAAVYHQLLD